MAIVPDHQMTVVKSTLDKFARYKVSFSLNRFLTIRSSGQSCMLQLDCSMRSDRPIRCCRRQTHFDCRCRSPIVGSSAASPVPITSLYCRTSRSVDLGALAYLFRVGLCCTRSHASTRSHATHPKRTCLGRAGAPATAAATEVVVGAVVGRCRRGCSGRWV